MSKNTRYFSDYQTAYNYYGGNVVPSTEIALVGDGSYVFVSSDNAINGNQQYFDANLTNDEIVSTMTYTAYNEGFAYGETVTYPVAYAAGEAYGYTQGYEGGYSYGYDEGYTEGEAQGGGEWMPIGEATLDMPNLVDLIDGTADSIDLYWDNIYDNFSKEEILDQESGDVLGYRYEWSEGNIEVENGGTDPETGDPTYDTYTIHVIHEEYPDPETGNYAEADGRTADGWFDFMFDNVTGNVISDLYENVCPVLRNVTLEAAPQGADYDYILNFETLASENDRSSAYDPVEPVTENGFYPVNGPCAFSVNVENDPTYCAFNNETLVDKYVTGCSISLHTTRGTMRRNSSDYNNNYPIDPVDVDIKTAFDTSSFTDLLSKTNTYYNIADALQLYRWRASDGVVEKLNATYSYDSNAYEWISATATIDEDDKIFIRTFGCSDVFSGDLTNYYYIYMFSLPEGNNSYRDVTWIQLTQSGDYTFELHIVSDPESGDSNVCLTISLGD